MAPAYNRKVTYDPPINFKQREHETLFISSYMDIITGQLVPNTQVYNGSELAININSLGCVGGELAGSNPVIGFFGDSGSFMTWPEKVCVSGTQNLNASVEGHSIDQVVGQYLRLKDQVNFIGGVFYTGWHNIIYGKTGSDYWRPQLEKIDDIEVIAHCTAHCGLTEECLVRGMEELISDPKRPFIFFGDIEPTMANVIAAYDGIRRFNSFLHEFCEERGRIFIDLDTLIKPPSYGEIPDYYWDICHTLPVNFPKIALHVTEMIGPAITEALGNTDHASSSGGSVIGQIDRVGKADTEGFRTSIYPIW